MKNREANIPTNNTATMHYVVWLVAGAFCEVNTVILHMQGRWISSAHVGYWKTSKTEENIKNFPFLGLVLIK